MRWPNLFEGVDSSTEEWIVDQMYIVSTAIIYLIKAQMLFWSYIVISDSLTVNLYVL